MAGTMMSWPWLYQIKFSTMILLFSRAVADWLTACDTQFLLDFVRPDFLMLRIIARGLVLWDCIQPTVEWVEANVPQVSI
jgi:anaphase-promoting complex subunit 1